MATLLPTLALDCLATGIGAQAFDIKKKSAEIDSLLPFSYKTFRIIVKIIIHFIYSWMP